MNTEHVILVVEDSADDVLFLERAIAKAGITARHQFVTDGDAAVRYLAGNGEFTDRVKHPLPTLVLLDLKLPRRSGLEVLQWLRQQEHTRSTIVVVLTSSQEDGDIARAYAAGANSYLVKPISPQKMNELVNALGLYWLQLNRPPRARAATDLG